MMAFPLQALAREFLSSASTQVPKLSLWAMLLHTPLLPREQVGRCKSSEDEAKAGVPVPLECLPQHRGTLTLHPAGA